MLFRPHSTKQLTHSVLIRMMAIVLLLIAPTLCLTPTGNAAQAATLAPSQTQPSEPIAYTVTIPDDVPHGTVNKQVTAPARPKTAATKPHTTAPRAYVVRSGDTLSAIATAHHTSVNRLMSLNTFVQNANVIMPGWRIALTGRPVARKQTSVSHIAPVHTAPTTRPAPVRPAPPASSRAAIAVQFAYSQLGKPYIWGASGPGGYDCSGLTMAAWSAAGVSLPHYTVAQYNATQHVSISSLQPGDLVFFYSFDHVGIYIGGGNVIASPHTGATVSIVPISWMPLSGAARP